MSTSPTLSSTHPHRRPARLVLSFAALLLFLVLCTAAPTPVRADTFIVVDTDGSVGDYAALATLLRHPVVRSRLRLVTVSGAAWGYGPATTRALCRFVSLAAAAPQVTVALGRVSSTGDAYHTTARYGGCAGVQGFPATPQAAALRGMGLSRSAVTAAYGAAAQLPRVKFTGASGSSCLTGLDDASAAFMRLLDQTSATRGDTVVYIQLSAATNLAAVAAAVRGRGSATLLNTFYSVMNVHALETGYSGGADNTSMLEVLSMVTGDQQGLKLSLYTPALYAPAVAFTADSWGQVGTVARMAGTNKAVAWAHSAWMAAKASYEAAMGIPANSGLFFSADRGPAASLVVLCTIDDTIRPLCESYRTAADGIGLASVRLPALDTGRSEFAVAIAGANVTEPLYYLVTPLAAAATATAATPHVFTASAAGRGSTGDSRTLAAAFWDRWLYVLQQ